MAKYYQNFVGLTGFIYEPCGYNIEDQSSYTYPNITQCEDVLQQDGTGIDFEFIPQNTRGHFYNAGGARRGLEFYQNYRFNMPKALFLPATASLFAALMLHRNGPYGWPSWKQIRVGENPLTRRQRKENILTIVQEPGEEFVFRQGNQSRRGRARYGSILKYNECPVVSKYDPVSLFGGSIVPDSGLFRIKVKSSLGNETSYFDNQDLNKKLGIFTSESREYNKMIELYLNGGLNSDESPIDSIEIVKYKEAVYPPLLYTFKNYTRQRTSFSFPWNDNLESRQIPDGGPLDGFDNNYTGSIWTMDGYNGWATDALTDENIGTYWSQWGKNTNPGSGETQSQLGILQNRHTIGYNNTGMSVPIAAGTVHNFRRPGPLYAYKHTLPHSASTISPNGMQIQGITYAPYPPYKHISYYHLYTGEAHWDTPAQSGKAPFYNSYDEYIQGAKQLGKDYTIIPEFRISNHVSKYQTQGLSISNPHFLEITGGLSSTTGSNEDNFYTIFSNSDFLENFKMVREQHKDIIDPINIKLTCKAIKKLLPYEGFYPQQRTVEITKQFYDSYKNHTSITTETAASVATEAPNNHWGFQSLMTPIAAPGVLFNAIKSGVAVDYPLVTSQLKLQNQNVFQDNVTGPTGVAKGTYYISAEDFLANPSYDHGNGAGAGAISPRHADIPSVFGKRVPFEALVEPEKYLAGENIFDQNPQFESNTSSSCFWDGTGDNLFKLMSHNFLAETSNFFLKNKKYTTLYSKPNNNPSVGMAKAGFKYAMRIKMFKSISGSVSTLSGPNHFGLLVEGGPFVPPQYPTGSNAHENFTMYSRPSAFGPPVYVTASFKDDGLGAREDEMVSGSHRGENYCYTPPYYYGQAWCEIEFNAAETKKYSIHEILQQSTASYFRFIHRRSTTQPTAFSTATPPMPLGMMLTGGAGGTYNAGTQAPWWTSSTVINTGINKNALQLSASVNLFGLERDESGDLNEETARWAIQTKWETPMLNFNHLSASTSITLPNNASSSVPRGMWHQYGRIEEDNDKGIFLQVTDIPSLYLEQVRGWGSNVGSLSDLVGFSSDPVRLGEIADEKEIREAVVAVPFIEEDGDQKFFTIPIEDIDLALDPDTSDRVGVSVKQMVEKMQRYVFPPSMDFLTLDTIQPFAMYIFEFKHVLKKQDLADIWQGLYPEVTAVMETAESSISHDLLAHELLGGGAVRVNENDEMFLDQGAKGNKLPDKLKWMVFKVKQRAKINYFDNIVSRGGDAFPGAGVDSTGLNVDVSYNWPYDFFSLVELAKIDAEVSLGKFKDKGRKRLLEPVVRVDAMEEFKEPISNEALLTNLASGPGSTANLGGSGGFSSQFGGSASDSDED